MALWQYTFYVLPESGYRSLSIGEQLEQSEEGFDDAAFWQYHHLHISFFDEISLFLPKGKSWHKDNIVFGSLESNCLEVIIEDEIIVSATLRVDYQSNYRQMLDYFIRFCSLRNLAMLDENLSVLPSDLSEIVNIIQNSPQHRRYIELIFKQK